MNSQVTYPGNLVDAFPPDRLLGYHGRHYLPMSATYNPETDRTTVELRLLTPDKVAEFIGGRKVQTIETIEDRMRVAELFGGAP